jgi:precorrin 3B synthase CobZ
MQDWDIVVVGSGNAGLSAALSATDAGARHVLLIDKCPKDWAGGNSYFTAGAYRVTHDGLIDLLPIVNNVSESQAAKIELASYTTTDFSQDIQKVCGGRSDPALSQTLIDDSNEAIKWLAEKGVHFQLSFNRQAYEVNGKIKFWGGLCVKTQNGGKGLIEDEMAAAARQGVHFSWSTALTGVHRDAATGLLKAIVSVEGAENVITTKTVIFAAGGFEANARMRSQYLGSGWEKAMVRGTPFNTGDCLEFAIHDLDAKPFGNWSGCHATCWDANADPHTGDREASNEYTKSGYPLGLMLNIYGNRFVDEGIDMRNYTYAKFGRAILGQPQHVAFQVWDAQATPWLREEEYREERVEHLTANSLEDLAEKCARRGLRDKDQFLETIQAYNEAVYAHKRQYPDAKWDPAIKDGLSTKSTSIKLELDKSNWALPLNQPPFLAIKVTCGITFTFGGLQVDPTTSQLLSATTGQPLPGLYCVGEMMGGLFYENYPGGSGLTAGTVFGRRAGRAAALATRLVSQL